MKNQAGGEVVGLGAEAARIAAEATAATAGKGALITTVTGGATAIYGGYTLNEWAIVIGVAATLGGLAVQIVVQIDAYIDRKARRKRETELHAARLAVLKSKDKWVLGDRGVFEDTSDGVP